VLETLPVASILQDRNWIAAWYIVAFCLFIFGLGLVSRPTTARQGNMVAAVGMLIAFLVTLGLKEVGNWGWIALGVVVGTGVGIPSALKVKMTAMPQMVALFNGVGGGAVALIAWVEFRQAGGDLPFRVELFSLFSAIIGSISFWGSLIAFGKLQELIPGRPIKLPGRPSSTPP
jgi:NAD(P) transhydrogenase subunit beta